MVVAVGPPVAIAQLFVLVVVHLSVERLPAVTVAGLALNELIVGLGGGLVLATVTLTTPLVLVLPAASYAFSHTR